MSKLSDHNEGQRDGSRASGFDEIMENFNPFSSTEYKEGYRHGVAQQTNANPDNNDSSSGGPESGGSGSGCFLSTACTTAMGLPDDCAELCILRRFRDNHIATMPNGLIEIRAYYDLAPQIVAAIDRRADRTDIYRNIYDLVVKPCVRLIEQGVLDDAFNVYKSQTLRLTATVLP